MEDVIWAPGIEGKIGQAAEVELTSEKRKQTFVLKAFYPDLTRKAPASCSLHLKEGTKTIYRTKIEIVHADNLR
jgi:hypothetical protein